MITRIEALNYRCLRYVSQPLAPFQILVGPNASGKTTFLDVVSFLGDLVADGLDFAVERRTLNFVDLLWGRSGTTFEIAVEAEIPLDKRAALKDRFDRLRYELKIGLVQDELGIHAERLLLIEAKLPQQRVLELFPAPILAPNSILYPKVSKSARTVVNKAPRGNDNFYDESEKGWDHAFKLGPRRSALANLPEDEFRFPVSTWWKRQLVEGIQEIVLNSAAIRRASPPGQVRTFRPGWL